MRLRTIALASALALFGACGGGDNGRQLPLTTVLESGSVQFVETVQIRVYAT